MSAVNALVRAEDYNNIRTKVVNVLGPGSGTSGWGQPVASSAVSTGIPTGTATRISIQEYAALTTDINNAHRHIFGTLPTLPVATENALVRFNTTTEPINRFNTFADQIVANRFTAGPGRQQVIEKGTVTATWPSATYGTFWNSQLNCLVSVEFTTATQARYFFNSGGEIRFFSQRTGGTSGRAQNNAWSTLLSNSGTRAWGGNIPSAGTTPSNGANYYRLTSTFNVWYSNSASSPYTQNVYRISARAVDLPGGTTSNVNGVARRIDFFIEWIDNYVDPGDDPADPADPGDEVDGTISLKVDTAEATGPLLPSGIFTVESPSVTINTIQQTGNNQRVTPSTFVPVNQPFTPVNAPPSTVNLTLDPVFTVFRRSYEFAANVNVFSSFQTMLFSSYYGPVTVNAGGIYTTPPGFITVDVDWTGAGGGPNNQLPPGSQFVVNGTNDKFISVRVARSIAVSVSWEFVWTSSAQTVPMQFAYRYTQSV
jgi:hypothetical protein